MNTYDIEQMEKQGSNLVAKMEKEYEEAGKLLEKYSRVISMGELLHEEFSDHDWIIEGLIPSEGITIISGPPASFKTWLLLKIAQAVSQGKKFLDTFETMQRNVLMIDEENGRRLIQKRSQSLNIPNDSNITLMSFEGFQVSEREIDHLIKFSKENDIRFIIIDSLIRIHASDENSSRDMGAVYRQLKRLPKEGIALLIAHHERKEGLNSSSAGNRMRGSSEIQASVNSHIAVKRSKKDKQLLTIEHAKCRDDEEVESFDIRVRKEGNQTYIDYSGKSTTTEDGAAKIVEAIVNLLGDTPTGILKTEIQTYLNKELGFHPKLIRSELNTLINEGQVRTENEGRNSQRCFLIEK